MYCIQCGHLCHEEDNVCTNCGNVLRSVNNQPTYRAPYAGFWIRFGALMIDSFVFAFGLIIILLLCLAFAFILGGMDVFRLLEEDEVLGGFIYLMYLMLSLGGRWLYYAFFESSTLQATPGKLAVGIKVTDEKGDRISFGRASGRYFGKILSELTLNIGYIMAGFTEKKQALHDLIAGTLVQKK